MNVYPIVTTLALRPCRDFYVQAFRASVLFESEWYVHLSVGGWEIGFLRPNPPRRLPVFQHSTLTRGLCLALEVADVRAVHDDLRRRGFEVLAEPEQYPSGELAFSVVDPSGTVLNVVERQPPRTDEVLEL